jgi:integrase
VSHDRTRVRYNSGTLRKEQRADGMVWVFRWSERIAGQRRFHKEVVGSLKKYPTESAANKAAEQFRVKLNQNNRQLRPLTFAELTNHYVEHELPKASKSTRRGNLGYIKNHIEPRWYAVPCCEMKSMVIEEWLSSLDMAGGSRLKVKGIMSTIFSHGVRWELVERNPVCGQGGTPGHRGASTGVRVSGKPSIKRIVLSPDVVKQTLEELELRLQAMTLLDAVTGLRASELMGLKWEDVLWEQNAIRSVRAVVLGEEKGTKSLDTPLPLAQAIMDLLRLWRQHTPYREDSDWIFASPHFHGKTPYTSQILFRRHIRPVIEKLIGRKSTKEAPIGWHTLRRSLASLLISNGANIKVTQAQLRHTTPKLTLELYSQVISADQHHAHSKIVEMILPQSMQVATIQ